jgi:hypothetical protein
MKNSHTFHKVHAPQKEVNRSPTPFYAANRKLTHIPINTHQNTKHSHASKNSGIPVFSPSHFSLSDADISSSVPAPVRCSAKHARPSDAKTRMGFRNARLGRCHKGKLNLINLCCSAEFDSRRTLEIRGRELI